MRQQEQVFSFRRLRLLILIYALLQLAWNYNVLVCFRLVELRFNDFKTETYLKLFAVLLLFLNANFITLLLFFVRFFTKINIFPPKRWDEIFFVLKSFRSPPLSSLFLRESLRHFCQLWYAFIDFYPDSILRHVHRRVCFRSINSLLIFWV